MDFCDKLCGNLGICTSFYLFDSNNMSQNECFCEWWVFQELQNYVVVELRLGVRIGESGDLVSIGLFVKSDICEKNLIVN